MKKLIIGTVIAAGILAGCASDSETGNASEEIAEMKKKVEQLAAGQDRLIHMLKEHQELDIEEEISTDDSKEETVAIKPETIDEYPQTLYKQSFLHVGAGESDKVVELYTRAEMMDNGDLAMDDGQNWLLVVKDGDKTYPLYDDYLQLGVIDFSVTAIDGKATVIMTRTAHSNTYIEKFTYDEAEDSFQKETIFETNHPV